MAMFRILGGLAVVLMVLSVAGPADARDRGAISLRGTVESGGTGLEGYEVSLHARFLGSFGRSRVLGRDTTGPSGGFQIDYQLPGWLPPWQQPLLFLRAKSGSAMLASALGQAPVTGPVVVNERTTVATGFAFAQFVDGAAIDGNRHGVLNAAQMAGNLAHPETGTVAAVLRLPPNGPETTTLPTFNSLANLLVHCTASETGCEDLFEATTLPDGAPPADILEAVANIAKYPWLNVVELFDLSQEHAIYEPALAQAPDAWTLFLKFTGSFSGVQDENNLMNGPGAIAIDRKGFLWVNNDNYVPEPPDRPACDGKRLLRFYPWGEPFPDAPYFGGGLSGAGFGISIAPDGLIWVGNFGFAGIGCEEPPADSVSVFLPNGRPISPEGMGFTAGPISWPQATVPDRDGNIWIANCAADSVTVYPDGRPERAFEIVIQPDAPGEIRMKPFGIAIDHRGRAWVTGSRNSTLAVIGADGDLLEVIGPVNRDGQVQLRRPMGVASDSRGNVWVSSSDFLDVPCPPDVAQLGPATDPLVTLFRRQRGGPAPDGTPFTGGGITLPWGIAVDGNDTVWVANFGFPFDFNSPEDTAEWEAPNRVSHFCGADTDRCPPTRQAVGQAISPDGTGYTSDALDRNTGISIDPSGNVWLTNNWKPTPLLNNPGGNSIAVLIGAAGPVKTPLIGTPRSFDRWRGRRGPPHAD